MRRRLLLALSVLVVLTAMVSFTRCGSSTGDTTSVSVGAMKF